jgi:hypothetical protein
MVRRRLVAIFVAWHVFAIAVASLPPSSRLSDFPERDSTASLNPAVYRTTLALDGAARAAARVEAALLWLTGPIRPAVNAYARLTGLSQNWAMFSNPPTLDQYMRVRYYVEPREARPWVATELILPAHREDQLRTFQSFRDSYRDKALAIALERFYDRRDGSLIAPQTRPEQLPTDLAPIARYFSREFAAAHLSEGEDITRVEIWVGTVANPRLGAATAESARLERAVALRNYYDGPVEHRISVPARPPYHAEDREADITWLLEYFEDR